MLVLEMAACAARTGIPETVPVPKQGSKNLPVLELVPVLKRAVPVLKMGL